MSLQEFDLIDRFFRQPGLAADVGSGVVLGIGDDCALLELPPGEQLAVTMDLLVADVHFPAQGNPADIACKALAVNLSDLAAMGAQPLGFTLGLSLPEAEEAWLTGFSAGLRELAQRYCCPLLGGDLTRGPLSIAIQAHGRVPAGQALRRGGACPGDLVCVSGSTGLAGLALREVLGYLEAEPLEAGDRELLRAAYYRPQPRLALGLGLRGLASAAIDVSDGLLADLGHIARASGVALDLKAAALPLAEPLRRIAGAEQALALALTAGDDYELAFCLPPSQLPALRALSARLGLPCTVIGEVLTGEGVRCLGEDGRPLRLAQTGFRHF